MNQGTIEMA